MIRRFSLVACGLSVFALLAACANLGASTVALPQRADGVENVSITRDRSEWGLATAMNLTVDGQDVGTLRRGESIKLGLEEGHYDIGVECSTSDGRFNTWRQRKIPIEVGQESV